MKLLYESDGYINTYIDDCEGGGVSGRKIEKAAPKELTVEMAFWRKKMSWTWRSYAMNTDFQMVLTWLGFHSKSLL